MTLYVVLPWVLVQRWGAAKRVRPIPLWALLGLCAAGCVKVNENFDEEDVLTDSSESTSSSDAASTTRDPATTMDRPSTTMPTATTSTTMNSTTGDPGDTVAPTTMSGGECMDEFEPNNDPEQSAVVGEVVPGVDKDVNAELEPDGVDWYEIRARPELNGEPTVLITAETGSELRSCIYIRCVEAEVLETQCGGRSSPDSSMGPWRGCCGPAQASFSSYSCTDDVVDLDLRVNVRGPDAAPCTPYALTISI